MIRDYLIYCLMSLIALQSVVAMADVHQLHQSGTEHLAFDHEHNSNHAQLTSDETRNSKDQTNSQHLDCQHCCHCHHGKIHLFLEVTGAPYEFFQLSRDLSEIQFTYISYRASPDNPPPIN